MIVEMLFLLSSKVSIKLLERKATLIDLLFTVNKKARLNEPFY